MATNIKSLEYFNKPVKMVRLWLEGDFKSNMRVPYSGNLLREEIFANLTILLSEEIFAIFKFNY